jgi:ribosomal protein L37E
MAGSEMNMSFALRSAGLTNFETPDIGDLATARERRVNVAICSCARVEFNIQKINCARCGLALFWKNQAYGNASTRLNAHRHKYQELAFREHNAKAEMVITFPAFLEKFEAHVDRHLNLGAYFNHKKTTNGGKNGNTERCP